jgi:hypothetical protein
LYKGLKSEFSEENPKEGERTNKRTSMKKKESQITLSRTN